MARAKELSSSVGIDPRIKKQLDTSGGPTPVSEPGVGATESIKKTKKAQKRDDYGKLTGQTTASTTPKADTVMPALQRAMFTLAKTLDSDEEGAAKIARQMVAEFSKSPEAMAAFKQMIPHFADGADKLGAKLGTQVLGGVARSALPLIAEGKVVRAILSVGYEIGGVNGRRLVGAVLRGLNSGKGAAGVAADVTATAARIGAKAPALGKVAGGLGKALPFIGNAANVLGLIFSVKALYETATNPEKTKGAVGAQVVHLACTVGGCFVPPLALGATAIDVGSAVKGSPAKPVGETA